MRTLLRSLILLALVVWVGGLLFFGMVVAPVAFGSLMPMFPDPALGLHAAGTMVRDSLLHLHDIGMTCGVILLFLCVAERVTRATRRSIGPQLLLIAVMLGLTAYSQFSIIPRMDSLQHQSRSGHVGSSFHQSRPGGLQPPAQPLHVAGRNSAVVWGGIDRLLRAARTGNLTSTIPYRK